jgi:transposase-like protein
MATILVKCKECGSTHTVRNGLSQTCFQRYKCNDCGKTFRLDFEKKAYRPGVKEQVLAMGINGSGTRDIARVLRSDKNTVSAVPKKNRSGLCQSAHH